jgi:KUP system potassium uptake protein
MAAATTMFITTPMLGVVARRRWGWGASAFVLTAGFLLIDGAFLGANLSKLTHGGWFPLIVGAGLFMVMATWKRGRRVLQERLRAASLPVDLFLEDVRVNPLPRVSGSAVFLTGDPEGTPHALLHNIKHNKVLHEQVLFLSVLVAEVPYVPGAERVTVKELGAGFFRVRVSYGFMQDPNVPAALAQAREDGFAIDLERTSYFLGREKLIPSRRSGMARWREVLFAFLSDNAQSATTFFRIPPGRVVELGAQLEI